MTETLDIAPVAEVDSTLRSDQKTSLNGLVIMIGNRVKAAEKKVKRIVHLHELEEKRFTLAEERTGEIIVRIASRGFLPLSEAYKVPRPRSDVRAIESQPEDTIHPDQYSLL